MELRKPSFTRALKLMTAPGTVREVDATDRRRRNITFGCKAIALTWSAGKGALHCDWRVELMTVAIDHSAGSADVDLGAKNTQSTTSINQEVLYLIAPTVREAVIIIIKLSRA